MPKSEATAHHFLNRFGGRMRVLIIAAAVMAVGGVRAQDPRMVNEATVTASLIMLASLCGEEPNRGQYAYSERAAKRAWGSAGWKTQIESVMAAAQRRFEASTLTQQAELCDGVGAALKALK